MIYREEHPRCTYCDNYDKGFCKKNDTTVSTILTACSCKDYTLDGNIVKKTENTKVRK